MGQVWRWSLVSLCSAAIGFSLALHLVVAPDERANAERDGAVIASAVASSVQLFAARDGGARRAGSGIVVSAGPEGRSLVVTAAHLVEPLVKQTVTVDDPARGTALKARILHSDPSRDVAVLEVEGLSRETVDLGGKAGGSGQLGDGVWVVSYPWGRNRTLVSGVISQVTEGRPNAHSSSIEGPVRLIDAAVSYGTSGGGVFDQHTGALLGIVRGYRTAKLSFPGGGDESLNVPIAGETTVIPTTMLLCVLQDAGVSHRLETEMAAVPIDADCPAG